MQSLSKRVLYFESTFRETQFQNLITMSTTDLLELQFDKLTQNSRTSVFPMRNSYKIKQVKGQMKQRQRYENYFPRNLALTKMTLIMRWTKPTDCQSTQSNRIDAIPHRTTLFPEKIIYRSAN